MQFTVTDYELWTLPNFGQRLSVGLPARTTGSYVRKLALCTQQQYANLQASGTMRLRAEQEGHKVEHEAVCFPAAQPRLSWDRHNSQNNPSLPEH